MKLRWVLISLRLFLHLRLTNVSLTLIHIMYQKCSFDSIKTSSNILIEDKSWPQRIAKRHSRLLFQNNTVIFNIHKFPQAMQRSIGMSVCLYTNCINVSKSSNVYVKYFGWFRKKESSMLSQMVWLAFCTALVFPFSLREHYLIRNVIYCVAQEH